LGRNQYIEFRVGDLPIVVSAPHGGLLLPAEIPDRTVGETARDANTDQLAEEIGDAFARAQGHRPHVIITRLHRRKLDANREIGEAAQGNPHAQIAWKEFHGFIEAARASFSQGLVVDLHGHGHPVARLELGYLLTGAELARTDQELNGLLPQTSVRGLAERRMMTLTTLLRGPQSLGAFFEQQGFASVPGPSIRDPGTEPFFSGGYNTQRHGSRTGGTIDAVQIEAHFAGVRDTDANRQRFAAAFVSVLDRYFTAHYNSLLR
jgi:N-formylglutamate amidohydrolase